MSRVTQTSGTVTSATGSTSSSTYAYDASSNLTILPSGATATYDQSGELVSSNLPAISGQPQISTTYSYNANGDRTRSQISQNSGAPVTETSATWNAANELMTYTSPSEAMTNATYNGLGLRTSATFTTTSPSTGQTNTSTENYLYDSTGSLPSLIMDSGHAYLYSNSISPYEQVNLITGKVTYLITGANGSVRGVMTQNGALEASTSYDAYGNPINKGGLGTYTAFGFAGSYTDPTGLEYMLNRYYDPGTGQFLSVDPLVDQTGQPYSYTGGDPINEVDPWGTMSGPSPYCGLLANLYCIFVDSSVANLLFSWSAAEVEVLGALQQGVSGQRFWTPLGDRIPDVYNYDLAMIAEVKTGTQSASQRIRGQICKDVYILNNYNKEDINPRPGEKSKKNETPVTNDAWIFLPNQSGVTNPSGPLLQTLSAANIPTYVVYYGDFPLGNSGQLNPGYTYVPSTVPGWVKSVVGDTSVSAAGSGSGVGAIDIIGTGLLAGAGAGAAASVGSTLVDVLVGVILL